MQRVRNTKRQGRNRRGFTLLELMIVLVILVGLIALVGPRLLGTQAKADIKTTKTQIGNLESALKMYSLDMRSFPSTEEGLDALMKAPDDEDKAKKWDGPYLDADSIPADSWGNAFVYSYPPENGERDFPNISSMGPDGQANTDDDIINWTSDSESEGSSSGSSSGSGSSGN